MWALWEWNEGLRTYTQLLFWINPELLSCVDTPCRIAGTLFGVWSTSSSREHGHSAGGFNSLVWAMLKVCHCFSKESHFPVFPFITLVTGFLPLTLTSGVRNFFSKTIVHSTYFCLFQRSCSFQDFGTKRKTFSTANLRVKIHGTESSKGTWAAAEGI